ncbi:MAG: class I SAM-dependent methyltransferase [Acidimicrobiales bacterium]
MNPALAELARLTPGFMPEREGMALHQAALSVKGLGPLVEIGSWRGRSAVYLGAAAAANRTVLFCVDHHRGSEELGPGWPHHDAETVDANTGRIDTLGFFRATIAAADLEHTVVAVVGPSAVVAAHWGTPLALVFIDGAHSREPSQADYQGWTPHIVGGGLLAIHDVFEDPADGGQGPMEIYRRAVASGRFGELPDLTVGSLRFLRRT